MTSNDCRNTTATKVCDAIAGLCVECTRNIECSTNGSKICDSATKACKANTDCLGGICVGNVCKPSCTDLVKNGVETDVDCGGGTCVDCAAGKACLGGTDCVSGSCVLNLCQ